MPSLRPQHTRRATIAAALVAAAGTAAVAFAGPANAATHHSGLAHAPRSSAARAIAERFVADVNATRRAHGLRPLAPSIRLTNLADRHSRTMATDSSLFHNLQLPNILGNWVELGENVGEGPTEGQVHYAFMHSPPHRANILDSGYTQIGVGVATDRSGQVWVTEDFRRPRPGTAAAKAARREIAAMMAARR